MPYSTGTGLEHYLPPADLVKRLTRLHNAFLKPPQSSKDSEADRTVPLLVPMTPDTLVAYNAYTKAATYDLLRGANAPDSRLHPNYARLHIQAAKIALSLAVMDWSDQGATGTPQITLGHWAKAQHIADTWRAAAHHLLDALNRGDDSRTESHVHDLLCSTPEGLTLRDLTRKTGLRRKAIEEALRSLQEAGLVSATKQRRGERGPEAIVFCAYS